MIRVGLYARVSTDEQAAKYGLAAQVHELRDLAEQRGYSVIEEYLDDGYSGAELERPALRRLRDAIRARAVERVLVHDPDRLSRKLAHLLLLAEVIETAGIILEYVTMPRTETPEGRLLEHVKATIAEYERAKIRERTLRGKREKARRGLIVAGPTPYGYRRDPEHPDRLVVDPDQARTVRRLFGWLVERAWTTRRITRELNRLGIPVPRGGPWALSTVAKLLRAPVYKGIAHYGRRVRVGGAIRPQSDADQIIAITVPSIIDATMFDRARSQLERNRGQYQGRPARRVYLLKGLVRCGVCGRRMPGWPAKGIPLYRCTGRNGFAPRPCPTPQRMPAEKLETLVWETVAGILRDPARLHEPMVSYQDRLGVDAVEVASEVEHLRRQLTAVDRQERRLLDLYLGDDDPVPAGIARDRVEAFRRRRVDLQAQLTAAQARQAAQTVDRGRQDAIRSACEVAARGLDRLTLEGRRELLGTLLDQITVVENAIIIEGALPIQGPESGEQTVPNITVQWYAGRTAEQRREITAAITEAMVRIGKTTSDQVHIVYQDVEKSHWGYNGKLASD